MTQEEKSLLLKDLCARLPYGVKVHVINDGFYDVREPYDTLLNIQSHHLVVDLFREQGQDAILIQPYLRCIRDMTENEIKELRDNHCDFAISNIVMGTQDAFDWLNSHHFDYRGLIDMGLALEAPKDMYDIKD